MKHYDTWIVFSICFAWAVWRDETLVQFGYRFAFCYLFTWLFKAVVRRLAINV